MMEKEGRFCVIDFEFAELVTYGMGLPVDVEDHRVVARKPKIQWASNNISTRRHDSYIAINLSLEQFNYVGSNGSVSMDEGDFVFALSGVQDCSIELLVKEAVSDGIRQVLRNRFELASAGIIAGGRDLVHDVYRVMCEKLCTYQKHYKDFDHIDSSLSLCWFTPFAVYYFHLGEGAIYHQQKVGEIKKLTKESTVEGKVPQSVYGLTVDTGVIEYAENDRFVIVSKELNSNLSEEELLSALCKGCNDIESSLDSLCENNIQNQLASAILIDIMPFV